MDGAVPVGGRKEEATPPQTLPYAVDEGRLSPLSQLLRIRKTRLEATKKLKTDEKPDAVQDTAFQQPPARSSLKDDRWSSQNPAHPTQSDSLSRFLQAHRGIRPQPPTTSQVKAESPLRGGAEFKLKSMDVAVSPKDEPAIHPQIGSSPWLCKLPTIETTRWPSTIVLSPDMFTSNFQLTRQLQSIQPEIHFVESGPSDRLEVDVTTPDMGIILTSLQRVKQRPLPGQTAFSGIRERVARIARQYERLFVLVGDCRPQTSSHAHEYRLDERDCKAMDDLVAFSSSMNSVEVRYVAGGDTELARWIITLASCVEHI